MRRLALVAFLLLLAVPAFGVEILFTARDSINPASKWKKGYPLAIREDNFGGWGTIVPPAQGGRYVLLKVPGVTVAQVYAKVPNLFSPNYTVDDDGSTPILHRMKWRILVDSLPAAVRQELNQTGMYSTTWAAIKAYIQNQRTGETAP